MLGIEPDHAVIGEDGLFEIALASMEPGKGVESVGIAWIEQRGLAQILQSPGRLLLRGISTAARDQGSASLDWSAVPRRWIR